LGDEVRGRAAIGREFLLGVNLPWQIYGCDFGANAWQPQGGVATPSRRRQLDETLAGLSEAGVQCVRWFLLCDGRAGVRWHSDRHTDLDEHVFADLDAALESLAAHRLQAMFAIFDFHLFRRARLANGVQLGGRRHVVTSDDARARLLDAVVAPILDRYRAHPSIFAWDLINEPEWATLGVGTRRSGESIGRDQMRRWLGELATLAHSLATQPVTVGSACAAWLDLVAGLGLDFYQVHWYDKHEHLGPLGAPVASLGVDRPVLLGEFPTRGSARRPDEVVAIARRAGYAGAFAWSVLATDTASDARAALIHLSPTRRA
jgi:hypothetical protein